jgi:ketosteroid isomerase-like protein
MGTLEAQNRQVVERYWEAHFLRDWDATAKYFSDDAHYTDVGVDGQGARGPQQIVDRLKIGIEPLSGYYHHPRHVVAEGDLVILEHVEE